MKNIYLQRYATQKHYFPDYLAPRDTKLIVVIPCHNEPNLIGALQSLHDCELIFPVEVITVINASEKADALIKSHNTKTYHEALDWTKNNSNPLITSHFILENEMPHKYAGVGLARKTGMDEAVRIFSKIGVDDGTILCYDADCRCTPNLLSEVQLHFDENPKSPACSIHFEHPLEGEEVEGIYEGIINYELHLRYYIDALKYAKFPYAHQTIGSSMAVKSWAYQKQGGMNRRKAGEDFYFLHKLMPLGYFTNVNTAMVIPSPRKSDRVPFGTGRAIGAWLLNTKADYLTYAPSTFEDLRRFFELSLNCYKLTAESQINAYYDLSPISIQGFVNSVDFVKSIDETNRQSTTREAYEKRFFQWWDGFMILKFVHYCRDEHYPLLTLTDALDWLFEKLEISIDNESLKDKLLHLRMYDKRNSDCT